MKDLYPRPIPMRHQSGPVEGSQLHTLIIFHSDKAPLALMGAGICIFGCSDVYPLLSFPFETAHSYTQMYPSHTHKTNVSRETKQRQHVQGQDCSCQVPFSPFYADAVSAKAREVRHLLELMLSVPELTPDVHKCPTKTQSYTAVGSALPFYSMTL